MMQGNPFVVLPCVNSIKLSNAQNETKKMSKGQCYNGEGLKKGTWSAEEDEKLISYIRDHGEGGWRNIPEKAGLKRCGKSCRLRWVNYLRQNIKRGNFSDEEEQIIIMLHASRGNKWSDIAKHLPERTDSEIKNHWHTHLKKRLIKNGIDPVTHLPLVSSDSSPAEPKEFDPQEEFNAEKHWPQGSSTSPVSLDLPSSSFNNPITEITRDETPLDNRSLSCKKRFERSSLLNKVAASASSFRNFLSTSVEGTLRSPTPSSSLPNPLSEHMFDANEDLSTSIDLSIPHNEFSQYLEHFNNNEDESENIGGYNQTLLISDVPSSLVYVDMTNCGDITGWSSYIPEHTSFLYEKEQDYYKFF
ncbi:unnamed protein product [Microthlaspi erraticum]|uniref:Uncharacterized protein n=1 Tax=Microthlaspi erraticum TaxID=1685480 RepID=A0A6D2HTY2_9BRAS|nr:unnamed protein product [Microthlaspi erraticum]